MSARNRHPLILPVFLPTLLLSFGRGMMIPILPLYAKSFDISYGLIGLVLAGDGIGMLIADLPSGLLLRRYSRKLVMILGVTCVAFSVLALFWATTITQIVLLRMLSGIGNSFWNISRHAYMTDVTAVYQRGRALSVFGGINRIGTFAGPAVGGVIAAGYGMSYPFLIYGALAVVVSITSSIFFEAPEKEEGKPHKKLSGNIFGHFAGVFKTHHRSLATAGSGALFAQMIRAGRNTIVPLFAADVLGLSVQEVGWIVSISAFVDMSMFYPAGVIMDRFGRKFAVVPCFFIQAVAMAMIPFTETYTGLLAVTCLLGFGNGIGSGTMMTLGADLAPEGAVGEFLGAWRLIGDSGQMGAPLVVGGVADLVGLTPATFVIAGFGLIASGIFALLVPETLTARDSEPGLNQSPK
jgi:MFS family permease